MSETKKDWKEEAAKWDNGINLIKASKDELTNYIQYKMYIYTELHD